MLHAWVTRWYAEHCVIDTGLVGHPEHSDGPAPTLHSREGGFAEQNQGVQRVAVEPKGVFDEPVIMGVSGRGEQHAIKANPAGHVVDFLLIAATAGDLDCDVEGESLHVT